MLQISEHYFLKMNLFIFLSSLIMKFYASWLANHSHDIWAYGDFQIIFQLEHFNLQQCLHEWNCYDLELVDGLYIHIRHLWMIHANIKGLLWFVELHIELGLLAWTYVILGLGTVFSTFWLIYMSHGWRQFPISYFALFSKRSVFF